LCVPSMSMSTPIRKLEKNLKNTNKFSKAEEWVINFPEGASPLHAWVTPGSVSKSQGGLG